MTTDDTRDQPGGTRYGKDGPSTGSNEPKRHERKERDPDWRPRQGGDQSRQEDEGKQRSESGGASGDA